MPMWMPSIPEDTNVNVFNHWSPAMDRTQACMPLFNACSGLKLFNKGPSEVHTCFAYQYQYGILYTCNNQSQVHTNTNTHTHTHAHTHTHTLWTLKDGHLLWMFHQKLFPTQLPVERGGCWCFWYTEQPQRPLTKLHSLYFLAKKMKKDTQYNTHVPTWIHHFA